MFHPAPCLQAKNRAGLNTMLSAIKASELLTLTARKRQSLELAKLKQRKELERLARKAEKARRVAEQARIRVLEEKRLVAEASAQSARRVLEDERAELVQRYVRRFAAKSRLSRLKLNRRLRQPDHIDVAVPMKTIYRIIAMDDNTDINAEVIKKVTA